MDFPVHESLYVIQETPDSPIFDLQLLCYNLEGDSFDDTEIIFTNPNLDLNEILYRVFNEFLTVVFLRQFTPSFNGNVTCRSRTTGKQSTVYIASKYNIMCNQKCQNFGCTFVARINTCVRKKCVSCYTV